MGRLTYQSPVSSPTVNNWHMYADYNPNVCGAPLVGSTIGNSFVAQSEGLYHKGNAPDYRFAQTVRNSWFADGFDFDTQLAFVVSRFDAQFGEHYDTASKNMPSYDESRLIYGR